MTWDKIWPLLWQGTQDTLLMTIPSTLLAYVLGHTAGRAAGDHAKGSYSAASYL